MGQIVFQATLGGQVAVAGPNTASSFTLTLPAATDTLVGKATTDTLTNKTLTSPTITGATLTTSAFNGTVGATTASTGAFTTLSTSSTTTLSGLTASTALALDASKNVVSVTNTGTGNNVLSASPTLTGTIAGASLSLSSLTSGRVTYAGASGLLTDSANLTFSGSALTVTGTGNFGSSSSQTAIALTPYTTYGSAQIYVTNSTTGLRLVGGATEGSDAQILLGGLSGGLTSNIYFDGANKIFRTASGTEQMRITSAGNVGIGTSSPVSKLDVTGQVTATGGIFKANGAPSLSAASAGEAILAPEGTYGALLYGRGTTYDVVLAQRSTGVALGVLAGTNNVTFPGLVGIGTTSPASRLHVVGADNTNPSVIVANSSTSNGILQLGSSGATYQILGGDYQGNMLFQMSGATPFVFTTNGSERVRIDSSGNLLVGQTSVSTTTAGIALQKSQGANIWAMNIAGAASTSSHYAHYVYSTTASAYRFLVDYAGTIFATNTTITAISDVRLKENIRDLDDGLNVIMALKPRKFDWKKGKGKDIKGDRGFIAQEFEQILPDMVENWADTPPEGEEPYKAVNANLIPTLVKAIQDQQVLIESLTTRLIALENK